MGIREAMWQACACIHEPTIIESDCLGIVHALNSTTLPDNYVGLILEEVRHLASKLTSCVFSHVRREANSLAHELSRYALISVNGNVWIGGCPEATMPIVTSELS